MSLVFRSAPYVVFKQCITCVASLIIQAADDWIGRELLNVRVDPAVQKPDSKVLSRILLGSELDCLCAAATKLVSRPKN